MLRQHGRGKIARGKSGGLRLATRQTPTTGISHSGEVSQNYPSSDACKGQEEWRLIVRDCSSGLNSGFHDGRCSTRPLENTQGYLTIDSRKQHCWKIIL